jgi:hypothetical protein
MLLGLYMRGMMILCMVMNALVAFVRIESVFGVIPKRYGSHGSNATCS